VYKYSGKKLRKRRAIRSVCCFEREWGGVEGEEIEEGACVASFFWLASSEWQKSTGFLIVWVHFEHVMIPLGHPVFFLSIYVSNYLRSEHIYTA